LGNLSSFCHDIICASRSGISHHFDARNQEETMKFIVTAIALGAMILSTGSAMAHSRKASASSHGSHNSGGQLSDVVCVGLGYAYGAVLPGGRDPDPFIRSALLKEYAAASVYPGQARPGGRCEGR
jgi:hypothetical protein